MPPSTARAALLLFGLFACGPAAPLPPPRARGAGAAVPRRGGTLRVAVPWDLTSLDPAVVFDTQSYQVARLVYGTLVDLAPADAPDPMALVPGLAERWEVTPDGLRYRFFLRAGLVYADGRPIVAEDFVFALDRLLAPEHPWPGVDRLSALLGARDRLAGRAARTAGIRAVGPAELELQLERPDPLLLRTLAGASLGPLPARAVAAAGAELRRQPLASGPFVLADWREGQSIALARNPRYWNLARVWLDRIVFRLQVPADTAFFEFLRGETDLLPFVSTQNYLRFLRAPAWQGAILKQPALESHGLVANLERPPLGDVRVRQALNYAIDREALLRLSNGRLLPGHGPLPPGLPGRDPTIPDFAYDPARARQLLREAGHAGGLRLVLITLQNEAVLKLIESLQADLADVGVALEIRTVADAAFFAVVNNGQFDLASFAWRGDDPALFLELFGSGSQSASNPGHYANRALDQLLARARAEPDRERRQALYGQAERLLRDDCPWIWLGHPVTVQIRQPALRYRLHPAVLLDFRDAWLDEPAR